MLCVSRPGSSVFQHAPPTGLRSAQACNSPVRALLTAFQPRARRERCRHLHGPVSQRCSTAPASAAGPPCGSRQPSSSSSAASSSSSASDSSCGYICGSAGGGDQMRLHTTRGCGSAGGCRGVQHPLVCPGTKPPPAQHTPLAPGSPPPHAPRPPCPGPRVPTPHAPRPPGPVPRVPTTPRTPAPGSWPQGPHRPTPTRPRVLAPGSPPPHVPRPPGPGPSEPCPPHLGGHDVPLHISVLQVAQPEGLAVPHLVEQRLQAGGGAPRGQRQRQAKPLCGRAPPCGTAPAGGGTQGAAAASGKTVLCGRAPPCARHATRQQQRRMARAPPGRACTHFGSKGEGPWRGAPQDEHAPTLAAKVKASRAFLAAGARAATPLARRALASPQMVCTRRTEQHGMRGAAW